MTFDASLGKDKDKLAAVIGEYDGLAIRSATKATAKLLESAKNLKVIGRAGIGVDNVDIPAATARGVIVMNTPFGNSITTAEHAIALMFALARQIPAADVSTHAGKWEKNRFMGVELEAKTLGLIGAGNIGSIVARKAIGVGMKVVAYDPYLYAGARDRDGRREGRTRSAARTRGCHHAACADDRADQEPALARSVGQDEEGRAHHQLRARWPRGRGSARRGHQGWPRRRRGLRRVLGRAGGNNPLFGLENVICTPHLGASTSEAQENVALQVAEQMSDYLLTGAITNAVNFPSISAEDAPKLKPFVALGEKLGSFLGQLTEAHIKGIRIAYEGKVGSLNIRPITAAAVAGVLRPFMPGINMVNAQSIAKDKGIAVEVITRDAPENLESRVKIYVEAEDTTRHAAGTVLSDGLPRIVEIRDIKMDAEFAAHMLYVRNDDKPGFIGRFGSLLGERRHQHRDLQSLGRDKPGGDAICFVAVDDAISDDVLAAIKAIHACEACEPPDVLRRKHPCQHFEGGPKGRLFHALLARSAIAMPPSTSTSAAAWCQPKGLVQEKHGKPRPDDRHEIGEDPRASRPDQLHPAHEKICDRKLGKTATKASTAQPCNVGICALPAMISPIRNGIEATPATIARAAKKTGPRMAALLQLHSVAA